MSDDQKLLELAERIEKASGLDRALDAECGYVASFGSGALSVRYLHDTAKNSFADIGKYHDTLPSYTASLDAAMTLVPEGAEWSAGRTHDNKGIATIYGHDAYGEHDAHAEAATPALALTAACLRAIANGAGR